MMNLRLWTPKKSPKYVYFSFLFCQRKRIELTNERFINKWRCRWLSSSIMFTPCHKWQFYSCSYKRTYLSFLHRTTLLKWKSRVHIRCWLPKKKSLVEGFLQMIFMDVGYILNKDYFGKYNSSLGMLCSITFLAE